MTAQSLSNLRLRLDEKRAFRIDEFCAVYGLGRTKTYDIIKAGKLRTVLIGGRRLVPKDAAVALLAQSETDAA
jgi:excisionase family DNA binding protein